MTLGKSEDLFVYIAWRYNGDIIYVNIFIFFPLQVINIYLNFCTYCLPTNTSIVDNRSYADDVRGYCLLVEAVPEQHGLHVLQRPDVEVAATADMVALIQGAPGDEFTGQRTICYCNIKGRRSLPVI